MHKRKIEMPMLDFRAAIAPQSFNEKENTIDVIWTTGARGLRSPFWGEPYYEELAVTPEAVRLDRLNNGAPLLNSHDAMTLEDQIGVVVSASIQNGQGLATVKLSRRPEIAGIVQDIKEGLIRNISVGYMVYRYEKVVTETPIQDPNAPPPQEIPIYRATDWEPMELSFVSIPFDAGAQVRQVEKRSQCEIINETREENTMPEVIQEGQAPQGNTEQVQTPSAEAAPQAEAAPAAPVQTEAAPVEGERAQVIDPEQIRAQEITRQDEIRKTVRIAGLDETFADKLVKEKKTLDETRALIFTELEQRTQKQTINVQVEGVKMDQQLARREAATRVLLHKHDSRKFALEQGDNEMMAPGLLGMARKILSMEGVRGAYDMSPMEVATRALHSTSDFPKVLENLANKSLRQAYEAAPNTYAPFVRMKSVSDFKTISNVMLSQGGTLQKLGEHGEVKRGTLEESAEKYVVETYALMIGATRKLLVNDDLGAFTQIPAGLGLRAKQKENEIFWGIILANAAMADGIAMMHASHGNLAASGAVISVATLGAARAAMRAQLDLDKQPINITPSYLVVPAALETVADQFVSQITPNQNGQVNPFAGRLQVIAEPRLDAGSTISWYVMADSSKIAMVEMAQIDGQGPKISVQNGWDVEGMETKIVYDFGMKALDYRGFYKNPGA